MLVEHARNVMGIGAASHAEYGDVEAGTGVAVVTLLECSLVDSEIEITITPGTRLARIHAGERSRIERTHCRFGLSAEFSYIAEAGGLHTSAVDATGEVRAIERNRHRPFIGTLYQPQRTSAPDSPHPIWSTLVRAVAP